jgi:hypothetical protein
MTVTTELNKNKIISDVKKRLEKAQYVFDSRVAFDSNKYAPDRSGDLITSVQPVQGKGTLEWNKPYARPQYYGFPNKSKDKNPNASMKWFEVAKSKHLKEWEKLANAEYNS